MWVAISAGSAPSEVRACRLCTIHADQPQPLCPRTGHLLLLLTCRRYAHTVAVALSCRVILAKSVARVLPQVSDGEARC